MFGETFYFGTMRKYVVTFGTLFNNIFIERENLEDGSEQLIKVPLQYAPREKMTTRVNEDPSIDRPFSVKLPRMAFEMTNWSYDEDRAQQSTIKVKKQSDANTSQFSSQFVPVAYNIDWALHIYAKNPEDGLKIIEQILPFFTPSFTVSVNLIPEMDYVRDIPVTLVGIEEQDEYDGDFRNLRHQTWTLHFRMKGYFFGPIRKTGVIKIANTSFFVANTVELIPNTYKAVTASINASANGTTLITLKSGFNTTNVKKGWIVVGSSNTEVVNTEIKSEITSVINSSAFAVNTDIVVANGQTNLTLRKYRIAERVRVSPGLDANGDPVNYTGPYPHTTDAISYLDVEEDDPYGFIKEIESVEVEIDD